MKRAESILLGLALSGCTAATSSMVGPNLAQISVEDLSTGSPRALHHRALREAAQIARTRGYPYFAVVSYHSRFGAHDTWAPGQIATPDSGGSTFGAVPVLDRASAMTVRLLTDADLPQDRAGIYSATAFR